MIDLYYWPTPNGQKPAIFLREAQLPHKIVPVNIGEGAQFAPSFLKIAPNNRIPAIVDFDVEGEPVALFESGAILLYLAEKTGKFIPSDFRGRYEVWQWLMWQMGGLGPMLGQNHHFRKYAPEQVQYAIARYDKEAMRLYAVLNKQLAGRDYICGIYSIADMACYPWMRPYEMQGINIADYPNVAKWLEKMAARPAVAAVYENAKAMAAAKMDESAHKILFGQTAPALPK